MLLTTHNGVIVGCAADCESGAGGMDQSCAVSEPDGLASGMSANHEGQAVSPCASHDEVPSTAHVGVSGTHTER